MKRKPKAFADWVFASKASAFRDTQTWIPADTPDHNDTVAQYQLSFNYIKEVWRIYVYEGTAQNGYNTYIGTLVHKDPTELFQKFLVWKLTEDREMLV